MSMEARATFLNNLESKLSTELTLASMNNVMSVVSDIIADFTITQIPKEMEGVDDLYDAYISAMKVQGRSDKTIWRYDYKIKRLMKVIGVNTRQVTVYHLRRYLADEKNRGISDVTLEGDRQIFCAYFNWLQREGLITSNPTANLGAIKCQKKVKVAYSDIDIERLKTKCKNIRDKAIVCFLISTGCRISEVTQLNIKDVDLINRECVVLGKGNKERTVYLDQIAGAMLDEYLNSRKDTCEALFCGRYGNRMTPGGIRAMLRKLARRAKVENVHPHKFRRTLATNLVKHGMPIQEVAAILGHEKLDTTMKYVVIDKTTVKKFV